MAHLRGTPAAPPLQHATPPPPLRRPDAADAAARAPALLPQRVAYSVRRSPPSMSPPPPPLSAAALVDRGHDARLQAMAALAVTARRGARGAAAGALQPPSGLGNAPHLIHPASAGAGAAKSGGGPQVVHHHHHHNSVVTYAMHGGTASCSPPPATAAARGHPSCNARAGQGSGPSAAAGHPPEGADRSPAATRGRKRALSADGTAPRCLHASEQPQQQQQRVPWVVDDSEAAAQRTAAAATASAAEAVERASVADAAVTAAETQLLEVGPTCRALCFVAMLIRMIAGNVSLIQNSTQNIEVQACR